MILAVAFTFAAGPVQACGCGVYLPLEGQASVSEEHALIRWDGQTEDIVMTLGVLGGSKEAAVIFPVPTQATVKLADAKVFDALRELTKPRVINVIDFFPGITGGGAPGAPPVTLLERQTLGPFDVSTLAATDVNALGDWLTTNGYKFPPQIADALEPYVAQNWYYVAVRLSPGASGDQLRGALDPLWITFAHNQIVYPMRPSALARDSLTVFLYVLADHRVQKPLKFGSEYVEFADWVDPAALEIDSPLAPFVPKRLFLTKIVEWIGKPQTIHDDYVFEFAPTDDTYHTAKVNGISAIAGIPICLWMLGSIGLIAVGSVLVRRRFRQRRLARSKT
jgi:hypothetical protein